MCIPVPSGRVCACPDDSLGNSVQPTDGFNCPGCKSHLLYCVDLIDQSILLLETSRMDKIQLVHSADVCGEYCQWLYGVL